MKLKRIFSILLVLCILSSFATCPVFALALGDVDGNNKINSGDARMVLRVAVKLSTFNEEQNKAADVNFDGKISAEDARLILRVSVNIDTFGSSKPNEYDILRSGNFYIKGRMIDSFGIDAPMEMGITANSTYMLADMDGITIAMLISGRNLYLIYPEKQSYTKLSKTIMGMFGVDVDSLLSESNVDFSKYKPLDQADVTRDSEYNGSPCKAYEFNDETGLTIVFMREDKILRLESYDTAGAFLSAMDIDSISDTVPENRKNPDSSYKEINVFKFMGLLEEIA